jgi:hypothetical protein
MLLDYALLTDPAPLQAGTPAALTFVISNAGSQLVTVTSIAIALPVGTMAKDLTANASNWQVQTSPGWNAQIRPGLVTLVPASDGRAGPAAIVVTIAGLLVNDQPGTAHVSIAETAAVAGGTPAQSTTSLSAVKFPPQFSLSDLVVTPPEVASGGSVSVMWSGPQSGNATYTLQYPGVGPISVPNVGPYQAANLTTFPAVFTLTVTRLVPGQDQPAVVQRQAVVMQAKS